MFNWSYLKWFVLFIFIYDYYFYDLSSVSLLLLLSRLFLLNLLFPFIYEYLASVDDIASILIFKMSKQDLEPLEKWVDLAVSSSPFFCKIGVASLLYYDYFLTFKIFCFCSFSLLLKQASCVYSHFYYYFYSCTLYFSVGDVVSKRTGVYPLCWVLLSSFSIYYPFYYCCYCFYHY